MTFNYYSRPISYTGVPAKKASDQPLLMRKVGLINTAIRFAILHDLPAGCHIKRLVED